MGRNPSSEFSEDDTISSSAAAHGDAMMTESGSSGMSHDIPIGIDASLGQQGGNGTAGRTSRSSPSTQTTTRSSTSSRTDSPTSMAEKRGNRSR
jgi:hypothetical protein